MNTSTLDSELNESSIDTASAINITFNDMFQAGGPVMYILLVLSVIALSVIILKIYQFQYIGLYRKKKLNKAISQWVNRDQNNAILTLSKSKNPVAVVCKSAMQGLTNKNYNIDTVREETSRVGNRQIHILNKGLWSLELIAMVSPLLGLFGTVLGMIEAFKALEIAGNQVNPAILSGGIWQALMTTAAGLAVAIPVLMIYKWIERKIISVGEDMEDTVTKLFTNSVHSKIDPSSDNNSVANPSNTLSYSNA